MKKLLLLFFIFLFPITVLVCIDNYFSEKSELFIEKEVTTIISDTIGEMIEKSNSINAATELLKYKYNNSGIINGIYIDSSKVNQILSNTNLLMSRLLKEGTLEKSIEDISLPLGMLISRAMFTTLGPNINIEVLPVTSYKTDVVTNLVDYGINNFLFEVYLKIDIEVETIIPLKQKKVDYVTNILLSSVVIQGEVPYYYYMGEGAIQSLPL